MKIQTIALLLMASCTVANELLFLCKVTLGVEEVEAVKINEFSEDVTGGFVFVFDNQCIFKHYLISEKIARPEGDIFIMEVNNYFLKDAQCRSETEFTCMVDQNLIEEEPSSRLI